MFWILLIVRTELWLHLKDTPLAFNQDVPFLSLQTEREFLWRYLTAKVHLFLPFPHWTTFGSCFNLSQAFWGSEVQHSSWLRLFPTGDRDRPDDRIMLALTRVCMCVCVCGRIYRLCAGSLLTGYNNVVFGIFLPDWIPPGNDMCRLQRSGSVHVP